MTDPGYLSLSSYPKVRHRQRRQRGWGWLILAAVFIVGVWLAALPTNIIDKTRFPPPEMPITLPDRP